MNDTILKMLGGQVWAIAPEKLDALIELARHRLASGAPSMLSVEPRAKRKQTRRQTAAVLPLHGVISHRSGGLLELFGFGTSTESFGKLFVRVMDDPMIDAVLMDIDSGGGEHSGTPELSRMIFENRGRKKITAIANSMAASAAFWIGSAADEFIVTPSGMVGSIGVMRIHTDETAAAEKAGVRFTVLRSAPYKYEGSSIEPLADSARAHFQSIIDEAHGQFVADLRRNLGHRLSRQQVQALADGRLYSAPEALRRGFVDRVASFDDVLGEISGETADRKTRAAMAHIDAADAELFAGNNGGMSRLDKLDRLIVGWEADELENAVKGRWT